MVRYLKWEHTSYIQIKIIFENSCFDVISMTKYLTKLEEEIEGL